jgi:hypothetical protein
VAVACGACHVLRATLLRPDSCELSNGERRGKSFLMRRPSLRKDRFFERTKYICDKVGAVYFGIIWKSLDDLEPSQIPYNRKHKLFALDLLSRFCGYIISRQSPHPTW